MDTSNEVLTWLLPALGGAVLLFVTIVLVTRGLAGIIARRYLTHFRLSILSVITLFAVLGTTLSVAALTTVTGISSGFQAEFQRKVLGVNAHVLVLKYLDFSEYRRVMSTLREIEGVIGVNPFVINEMMIVSGTRIAGVLLKGVDPELMPTVLDLPDHIVDGSLEGLRLEGRTPPAPRTPAWRRAWSDPARSTDELDARRDEDARRGSPDREEQPHEQDGDLRRALEEEGEVGIPGVVPRREAAARADDSVLDDAVADALGVELEERAQETTPAALPGIVLGRTLARELDARVGDTVRIVTPLSGLDLSMWAPESQTPRSRELRVIGHFYSGFDEYDTRLVYVDLFEAQMFFDHGDVVTGVELRLDDPNRASVIAREVEERLGGTPYRVLDWEQLNHNLFTALRIQKIALTVVVSALVMVSALLIIATLVLMIFEKKREIAILKAMGATNGEIMWIFVLVGSTIGSLGTFLGVALGYGVCRILIAYGWPLDPGVYLIDHLPIEINIIDYTIVSCVAFGISVLSTIFPAWLTAATMKPVDGLRAE